MISQKQTTLRVAQPSVAYLNHVTNSIPFFIKTKCEWVGGFEKRIIISVNDYVMISARLKQETGADSGSLRIWELGASVPAVALGAAVEFMRSPRGIWHAGLMKRHVPFSPIYRGCFVGGFKSPY